MNKRQARIDWGQVRNVLIVRDDRLGDMALYLVVIQNLARHLRGQRINVLCSSANVALVEHDPAVDDSFVINDGRLPGEAKSYLESNRPDVVVYYQDYPNFQKLAVSLTAINPDAVCCSMVKDEEEGQHFAATFIHHGKGSMYERNVGYAAWLLGIDKSEIRRPQLYIDQQVYAGVRTQFKRQFSDEYPLVHVNLSGGNYKNILRYLRRYLRIAGYVRTIQGIKRRCPETNFVVTAAPGDAGVVDRIIHELGGNVFFYRTTSVQELVSVMKLSSMVITPETAVSHIASVLNKRLVALFFAERQMLDWRPFSDRYRCVMPRLLPLVWTINGQDVADAALELLQPGQLLPES